MGMKRYIKRLFLPISKCKGSKASSDERILNSVDQKIIFVIGTGRSGTHWLGYILEAHPNIKATIEEPAIFKTVTEIALDQQKKDKLFPKLVKLYRKQLQNSRHHHYTDKSHPNIWIAEDLAKTFDNAYFIGIIRNPYGTVASMLRHKEVLGWHKKWREYPVPNAFLGITEDIAKQYDELSLPERCTIRWIAHYHRMEELQKKLGSRLLVISYEDLIRNSQSVLEEVREFLDLTYPPEIETIKKESLSKWKRNLSERDIDEISRMLVKYNLETYVQG